MRVCLMIEGQEDVTWEQWLALAGACEEHGLEALFRSDHYGPLMGMPERGSLDAWAILAGLAARTSRIRLGTLVSPATFRHPSVLAKSVVTADHISGGRVELGLGAGWHEGEHRAFGFDFPPTPVRMERLAEQLEIVSRTFTEDTFSFSGRHNQLQDLRALPKPVQRPRPTLLVGGAAGPKSLALAARWADEYNTTGVALEELPE
ncbi:MAG TPA: LLM class flavin-dependent oxidoreductase, partial [Actinomycetes bacterium]|nr:LLM class flavin-dependent oxidoreductase [Actinomycetes bacterium]